MMLKINWVSICHPQLRVPNTAYSSDFPTKIIHTSLLSPILYTTFALHLSRNTSELHPHCEHNDAQLTAKLTLRGLRRQFALHALASLQRS
jgi:hypothetical protein